MHLTHQTVLAIQTMALCASTSSALGSVSQIAKAQGISPEFLVKLIRPLVKSGLLQTVRGRGGGIRVSRPPDEITLLEIVRTSEAEFVLAECFRGDKVFCPLLDGCDLNIALHTALDAFFSVLGRHTLADFVDSGSPPRVASTLLSLKEAG